MLRGGSPAVGTIHIYVPYSVRPYFKIELICLCAEPTVLNGMLRFFLTDYAWHPMGNPLLQYGPRLRLFAWIGSRSIS